MSAAKPAIGIHRDERGVCTVAFLREPRECGCGRMSAAFVNRDGTSRCVECDVRYCAERTKGTP